MDLMTITLSLLKFVDVQCHKAKPLLPKGKQLDSDVCELTNNAKTVMDLASKQWLVTGRKPDAVVAACVVIGLESVGATQSVRQTLTPLTGRQGLLATATSIALIHALCRPPS